MIVVTGATGQLGKLVVQGLLKTLPADQVVAAARTPAAAAGLGAEVREADYDRPDTLVSAFAGAETVLLVSGSEIGKRIAQHAAVVRAAATAGVRRVVYTSAPQADTSPLVLAPEHKATEEIIRESGLAFTILRNGWYTENYADSIAQAAKTGALIGSAGDGRVASATRADYAEAAVAVLTGQGHEGRTYELSGDVSWSYQDLAAEIAAVTGGEVAYRDLPADEHRAALTAAGLPAPVVELLVSLDGDIARGLLAETSGELCKLIGRATTPMPETVRELLATG
ncbi:NAD(P)H dehydrogenase (quinone) [Amycolatopsis marina]|uniref:NAD(P)H dehydrogenase (Quinone) n=1 Tax=Amycolatopsis marina TaxID=490629 RepID=A0A1I1CN54_9PSEU|nr:SDR family oxidoreductase [Amycolatopsis marina]SFB62328.1 NAD(P)H dehydrogenase (quinone) [Amycolatopsis marina]